MEINKEVKKLFKKYSDGYSDPFRIANNMDIIVVKEDLGETRGYITYYKRNFIIGINNNLSEKEQKRVCFHEIGHRVLHTLSLNKNCNFWCKKAYFSDNKYEKQADLFALYCILNSYDLDEIAEMNFDYISHITGYPLKYIYQLYNI